MRFVSYAGRGGERLGILVRDQIIDALECARHRRLERRRIVRPGPADRSAVFSGGLDLASIVRRSAASAVTDASSVTAARAAQAIDHPVCGQQLSRAQSRKGQYAAVGQGAGVFRQDRRLRDRSGRWRSSRTQADQEARLRNRARHRHRQAGPSHPGRAARSIMSSATPSSMM